jgi:hypothetical protein
MPKSLPTSSNKPLNNHLCEQEKGKELHQINKMAACRTRPEEFEIRHVGYWEEPVGGMINAKDRIDSSLGLSGLHRFVMI